jgi:hypothetical protein
MMKTSYVPLPLFPPMMAGAVVVAGEPEPLGPAWGGDGRVVGRAEGFGDFEGFGGVR